MAGSNEVWAPGKGVDRTSAAEAKQRWELYRHLADPIRPRLLALVGAEELGVGEIAELLGEPNSKVSRQAAALRDAGLVVARRHGTWSLLSLAPGALQDHVIADAVHHGRIACQSDGSWAKIADVLVAREQAAREFFARPGRELRAGTPSELGAYLSTLGALLPDRSVAVDVGTGDGALLEVLAPTYERVVAVDRSSEQLALAAERVRLRRFGNVDLVRAEVDGGETSAAVERALVATSSTGGADAVFASRVLHHAPRPAQAVASMAKLARPRSGARRGGAVVVIDYEPHEDAAMREVEADHWLGFEPGELARFASLAGLENVTVRRLPAAFRGDGPDAHLIWQMLVGWRGHAEEEKRIP